MRRLVTALAVVCAVSAMSTPSWAASADQPRPCEHSDPYASAICNQFGDEVPGHEGHGKDGGAAGAVQNFAFFYLPTDTLAGRCIEIVAFPVDAAVTPVNGSVVFAGGGVIYSEIGPYPAGLATAEAAYGIPVCPSAIADILPQLLAAQVRKQLATPKLHIAPGVAITGKPAYLEIADVGERDITLPNPFGGAGVTVHVKATYTIDWGDGTAPDVTQSNGGPWPDGDITHVYQDARPTTVTVTADWNVTFEGAALPGRFQTRNTLGLPIQQVQAVIVPAG